MKWITVLSLVVLFAACETKPFVKHDLDFEKIGDDCKGKREGINMNSNLNGDRFKFQSCLDFDFKEEQLISERKGDTVILSFKRVNPDRQALYDITIDLDTYPKYTYLIIDGMGTEIKRYDK